MGEALIAQPYPKTTPITVRDVFWLTEEKGNCTRSFTFSPQLFYALALKEAGRLQRPLDKGYEGLTPN